MIPVIFTDHETMRYNIIILIIIIGDKNHFVNKGGRILEAANQTIRKAAKAARVPLWMLAEKLGVSEPTMTRKLRRELDSKEQ